MPPRCAPARFRTGQAPPRHAAARNPRHAAARRDDETLTKCYHLGVDELDRNLLEAFDHVAAALRRDPALAARRRRRQARVTLRRPPRPWCLALRAADTRINDFRFILTPVGDARDQPQPHDVLLTGPLVSQLTAPVHLAYPGRRHTDAADMLGVERGIFRRWIKKGLLQVRYERATVHGRRGKPVPVVWHPSPLDPQASEARTPDPVWGTLWQTLHRRVPATFKQHVRRVPRTRPWRDRASVHRGWLWCCPGLIDPDGQSVSCGRRVRKLYLPLPPWTLQQALELPDPIDLPRPPAWRPRFACKQCWQPQYFAATAVDEAWNQFITHITAGVLVGREVARPRGVCRRERRHHYRPKPPVNATPTPAAARRIA